jgi:hypothetical protein
VGQFTKQWEMTSLLCAHCLPANRAFQKRKWGAFHLPEIPEILLENQMERVKDSGGGFSIPDFTDSVVFRFRLLKNRGFSIPDFKDSGVSRFRV